MKGKEDVSLAGFLVRPAWSLPEPQEAGKVWPVPQMRKARPRWHLDTPGST